MRQSIPAAAAVALSLGVLAVGASSAQAAVVNSCSGTGTTFAGGAGTTASPYQVATRTQLAGITVGYRACAFVQTADIDVSGSQWSPIGATAANAFTGTYDGQGHSVNGVTITASAVNGNGLFGYGDGAVISNLTVTNTAIDNWTNAANRRSSNGALIGSALNTTIANCHSSGSVIGKSEVGGLVGSGDGTTIADSSSSATVAGNNWDVGGLVGALGNAGTNTITSSFATGNVTNTSVFTGGLVGGIWGTSITITRSYATGNVTYTGGRGTGYQGWGYGGLVGLIGATGGTVSQSYATGNVSGGRRGTGGLLGTGKNVTVSDSYATGRVEGDDDTDTFFYISGLWGASTNVQAQTVTIVNTYSVSPVSTFPAGGGGGIFGKAHNPSAGSTQPNITASFWSNDTTGTGLSSAFGTQVTGAQMKTFALYKDASWDIVRGWAASGTWGICSASGSDYPFLLWQYKASPCGDQAAPGTGGGSEAVDGATGAARAGLARLLANRPFQRQRSIVTTGRVPEGATVVVQSATAGSSTAKGMRANAVRRSSTTCPIRTTPAGVKVFICAQRLARGPWTLSTEARDGSTLIASISHAVTVKQATKPVAVTG